MNTNNNRQIFRNGLMYIMIFVAIVGLVSWFNQGSNGQTTEVSYTQFVQELKKGDIKEIKMQYANSVYTITGEFLIRDLLKLLISKQQFYQMMEL